MIPTIITVAFLVYIALIVLMCLGIIHLAKYPAKPDSKQSESKSLQDQIDKPFQPL
jgi:hypothetical protein